MRIRLLPVPGLAAALLVPAAWFGSVPGASAQGIEEVVVTARQREETLEDVPASITAFTAADLERSGVQRAEDFVNLTPGVAMVNTAEVGDTNVSIRGINGARDAEANFAFIIDGVLYTNPSSFNREFVDLQQIEILKGPQGALYGRSAAAGAIIVTTRKPDELEASVEASYASHESIVVQSTVAGPIVEDTLSGRLSIDYRDTGGSRANVFLNDRENVNDFENYNVNGRLLWEPTDRLTVDAKARYGEVDAASIAFNAAFALPPFAALFGNPEFDEDVNDHEFLFVNNVDPENEQETKEFSVKLDYEMDWATITAWALYSDVEQYFLADGTSGAFGFYFTDPTCLATTAANAGFSPMPGPTFIGPTPAASLYPPYSQTTCDGYQYQERNQEDISFEVRLTSSSDQRLRWQVGFYYLDLERTVGVGQYLDDGRSQLPATFNTPLLDALVHDRFDTEVFAGFGSIFYDVTPDIEVSFALRYDEETREVTNLVPTPDVRSSTRINYLGLPDGTPLNPAFINDFAAAGASPSLAAAIANGSVSTSLPDREETFDQLQPKISASWDVTDDWTLFASWGIGFKSGGFNNIGSNATIQNFLVTPGAAFGTELVAPPDVFDKETSSSFEVGFKGTLMDGLVKTSGALFYTEIDDLQFFEFFVGPFGLLRVVENIDEASIFGVELGASAQVTNALTVTAGWSLINGQIDENRIRPNTVGNEIPNAPEYTFNLTLDYLKPAFDGIDFIGRVDWIMIGETWFHTVQDDAVPAVLFGGPTANFQKSSRDEYQVMNVRAGFQGERWRVQGFINNLMNDDYIGEVISAPEFGGSFVHPGVERHVGIEFQYDFF